VSRERTIRIARICVPVATVALGIGGSPSDAAGQFSHPCGLECAVVLGAVSVTFATGATAAIGRLEGGYHTAPQAATVWIIGFTAAGVGGTALSVRGVRQRDGIYGAAIGAIGGAVVGLAAEAFIGHGTSSTRWAASLIGAAAGVLVGGAVGALSADPTAEPHATPAFSTPVLSIPIGR